MSATPMVPKWSVLVCSECGRTLNFAAAKKDKERPMHRCLRFEIREFDVEVPVRSRPLK